MTARDGWTFAFQGKRLLVAAGSTRLLTEADAADLSRAGGASGAEPLAGIPAPVALPRLDGRACRAYDLPPGWRPPPGFELVGLRALEGHVTRAAFDAAGAALQKLEWIRTHAFCSRCGGRTRRHAVHEAMACEACGQLHFPRLAPAVIVLVRREREMLLGRSPRFPEGVYSTLAGFVEPGESLEDAVHREIAEEVGVRVGGLRYFGSQPWPFPHSLMVGFVADWAGGEVRVDGDEIEDAGWFDPGRMPPRLPSPLSIARRLIDSFLAEVSRTDTGQ